MEFLTYAKMNTTNNYENLRIWIPFLIISFLEFVVFCSEDSDFSLKSEMCIASTNVAILLLLLKRAIIAPS